MNVKLHLSMLLMALLPASLLAQQEPIRLTFAGAGESEQVDQVTVDNLTQGTTLTLDGSSILILNDQPTGIEEVEGGAAKLTRPLLYPNPAETDANLVFDAPEAGLVSVKIYDLKGALVDAAEVQVENGRNSVRIPTQGHGFFIVRADGAGIHFSQKWMSCAPKSFAGIGYNGLSSIELPLVQRTTRALAAAEQPAENMKFAPGDVLRLTGKSGNMKTIVMRKPEMDHTVTFQFFKCQDANGYNYPIVEAGGMLWMAEDLRPVKVEGVAIAKDARYWTDPKANALRMAYADFDEGNTEQGAYYTPKAAIKAMPAGWKLPTADELKLVQETYGGADKAAAALKAHGDDSNWGSPSYAIDEVQLNLGATGMLQADGSFTGIGTTATVVTRNFNDGLPHIMNMTDGSDATELTLGLVANAGEAFTVRGVRPAMSPYNGFISNYLSNHPENAPRRIAGKDLLKAGLEGNPFAYTAPLGQVYEIPSGTSDFVVNNKIYQGKYDVLKDNMMKPLHKNQLHRYVGQSMPNGLQRTVRVAWSKVCQVADTYSNAQAMFESLNGSGTIQIDVVGDASEPDFSYSGVIDKGFNFPGIKYSPMPEAYKSGDQFLWNTYTHSNYENREQVYSALQAQCADFNGDGIDDILTGMGSKVVIIDGANYTKTLYERDFSVSKDQGLGEISCSTGDINKDGVTDLVIAHQDATTVYLEAWWNGLDSFNGESQAYLPQPREDFVTHGVLVGDLNEDGNMDVILQQLNTNKQKIQIFSYNNKIKRLEKTIEKDFENPNEYIGYGNREMTLVRSEGLVKPPHLFASRFFYKWDLLDNDLVRIEPEDWQDIQWGWYSGTFGAGNFDNNQDGREALICVENSFTTGTNQYLNDYFTTILLSYDQSTGKYTNGTGNNVWADIASPLVAVFPNIYQPLEFYPLCAVRNQHPIRVAELSSIETTMAEPRIYAVLSAPPHWGDYQGKYADNGGTSWGKTKASGGGTSKESSSTGSAIFGYEQEFNLPLIGTKVGGVDFETRLDWTSTQSQQKTTMTEYGIEYSTIWQDAVVLTFVPYTAYNYVITKSGNEDEIGNTLMVGMPDQPRTMMVSMKNYMELRADNNAIPNLRNLLQHEPGNPWSYKEKYVNAMPTTSDILWGGGDKDSYITTGSAGNTTRTIAVTTEMESTNENEFAMDITLVGTVVGVKAGGGYGSSNKDGIIHKQEVGMEVSGTVPTPEDLKDVKAFRWNFCRANVLFGGQKFPVVTYIVKQ